MIPLDSSNGVIGSYLVIQVAMVSK